MKPALALNLGVVAILVAAYFFVLHTVPARAAGCTPMVASWYGVESGNRTADGSYFDGTQMVAAHRTMKFGTKLRVAYRGKSVVVTVRDRGPFIRGRSLDLSKAAAKRIGLIHAGVGKVCVTRL